MGNSENYDDVRFRQEPDPSSWGHPRSRSKKRSTSPSLHRRVNPISSVPDLESSSTQSGSPPSTAERAAQFASYLSAYQATQAKISAAIFPIIDELTDGSNSSLIYTMAWSLWVDLTRAPQIVRGPYSHGGHAFDQLEEEYASANNLSKNDTAYIEYIAMNAVLIEWYQNAWARASAAANATGLLTHLATLNGYLITNDTAIMPPGFKTPGFVHTDISYFTNLNRTPVPGW